MPVFKNFENENLKWKASDWCLNFELSSTAKNLEETGGGGKVFYQPDAVDDWDDEDPDDDLDI